VNDYHTILESENHTLIVSVLTFDDEHWEADITLRNRSWSGTPAFLLKTSLNFRLVEKYKGQALKSAISRAKRHLRSAIGDFNSQQFKQ
jgi:hypothetical protein